MPNSKRSSLLFEPPKTRGLATFPNRFRVAAMCQNSCMAADGMPQRWRLVHLGSFAVGRAGMIKTEATGVRPGSRVSTHHVGIWNGAEAEAWKPITEFAHSQEVPIAIQLASAGRKASMKSTADGGGPVLPEDGGWVTEGPPATAFGLLPEPHDLTAGELSGTVDDFVRAALRAVDASFDASEVHGARGYLLHTFICPLSNGNFENRARLLYETVTALRAAVPEDMPILVRLSVTDWVEGGWDAAQTNRLAPELERGGVDSISVSSGCNDHRQEIPVGPGYQVPFARAVKQAVTVPVGAATSQQAESLLVDGAADVSLVARQFLREAKFPLHAAYALVAHPEWLRCYRTAKYEGSIP